MSSTRFPFRLSDCGSHPKKAANELALIRRHFTAPVPTCAVCTCGKPRFCFEISGQGLARLSCEFLKVGYRHVVAVRPEHAGMIWPGCPAKTPEIVSFNLAVAYGAHRGFDLPAKCAGAVAGPILTGGGTIYRPNVLLPVYPSCLLTAKELAKAMNEFSSLIDRFWLAVGDSGPVRVAEPVIEDDQPEIKVAPMPKRLRFGGAA